MLNQAFRLADKPEIKPSEPKGVSQRGAWLDFSGPEAVCLAQFCLHNPAQHPILIVECTRGPNKGAHIYEGFRIGSISHTADQVSINGFIDEHPYSLRVCPEGVIDETGTIITRIQTLPGYFPQDAYLAFRQQKFDAQPALG